MKKIVLSCALVAAAGFAANAQVNFSLEHEEMTEMTAGADPSSNKDNNSLTFYNHVKNISANPITDLKWSIVEADFPFGWSIWTLCDNNICYVQSEVNQIIAGNMEMDFNVIDVDTSSLLKPQIWVPTSGDDGTGVLKIRVFDANHSDTAVFIVTKSTTSINKIQVNDSRVSVFPNPGTAAASVNVFVNKALNAKEFVVVNVLGAQVAHQLIKGEVSTIATANLAHGNYLIKILDQSGNVITTRKWAK